MMKKKSHHKFTAGGQKQPSISAKKVDKTAIAPASVSTTAKNSAQRKSRETGGKKPWYKLPVTLIIFILIAVAAISGIAGYISNLNTSKPSPDYQINIPQNKPPAATAQNNEKIVVSDIEVTEITASSITVKWKTNIHCMGEAHATYETRELTISSFPEDKPVNEHTALIAGLAPSTSYKIQVISRDSSGSKQIVDLEKSYQTVTPRTAIGLSVGDTATDFSLASTAGKAMRLSDYNGKWIVLVFWDLNCSSCKEQSIYINNFYKGIPDDVALLTVSLKGQATLVESYIKNQKFSFPVLLDMDGAVSEKFTIASYPTTFLLDGNRIIKRIKEDSFKSDKELVDFIQIGMRSN